MGKGCRGRGRGERKIDRKKERKAWLGVIANADGYEEKADGVSD